MQVINELVERIKVLEENQNGKEVTLNENDDDETEMNVTFANPYHVIKCEICDFVAKTSGGLQVHVRANHKEVFNESESSEIDIPENNAVENSVDCDESGLVTLKENNLEEHENLKHESESGEIEIKLEVFTLVETENDVLKARQIVMDNLNEQSEVENVKTVYVSKDDSYIDKDGLRWNTIDIVLTTKVKEIMWKDKNFKQSVFSKSYLWDTVEINFGELNRAYFLKQK